MKSKKLLVLTAAALTTIVLTGCNNTVKVESVQLGSHEVSLEVGEQTKLEAKVNPENASNKKVTWVSGDTKVFTVSDGTVKAVGAGENTLTAYVDENNNGQLDADEKSDACKVVVTEGAIEFEDASTELLLSDGQKEGASEVLKPIFTSKTDSATWKSSDPTKVSVTPSEDGRSATIKALAWTGSKPVTITATSVNDPNSSAEILVTVAPDHVSGLSLSDSSIYLVPESETFGEAFVGGTVKAFGKPSTKITWSVEPSGVCVIEETQDGTLKVTGKALGNATITAVAGEVGPDQIDYRVTHTVNVVVGETVPANGPRSFVGDEAKRLDILGTLEEYAVKKHLTGISFMGDGSTVVYQDNIEFPVNKYVTGYGFGILPHGDITADLEGETKAEWKRYYHSFQTDDPGSLNYMNDKGSVVGDLIGYVSDTYFTTYLNEQKDGYEWVGSLSKKDRPIPLNSTDNGKTATKFKFPVKVGEELKYTTNSKVAKFAEYNNKEAVVADYVTPWQIYFTQAYGLARSAENLTGAGSIKGAEEYFNGSKTGFNKELWDKVGIKGYMEGETAYLEFEFNQACTPFYAMYYLSSGMYQPVPESFIKDALGGGDMKEGVKNWGVSNSTGTESPMDHYLCTGPYAVEAWNKDQEIVFKKNPNFDDDEGNLYKIKGVHFNILAAAKSDNTAAIKEWEAKKLSAAGVPSTYLDKEYVKTHGKKTGSTSNYKLNVNTCNAEEWEALFGENGSITKTPKSQYWQVEPAMHNSDFVDGLSYAIDREGIANKYGRTEGYTYFADAYLSDPEKGISYNTTEQHQKAMAKILDGTVKGYSVAKATESFKKACKALIDEGSYQEGDTIHVEIAWQEASDENLYHQDIKNYIEGVFNSKEANLPLKLAIDFHAGAVWSDVYYKKMMVGQFDIGFGSISGNSYDPLSFLEVLRSDNSSGFTLNWGVDTGAVDGQIVYAGEAYSFNALWEAATKGAYIEGGVLAPLVTVAGALNAPVRNADGSMTIKIAVEEKSIDGENYGRLEKICLFATTDEEYSDYAEYYTERPEEPNDTWQWEKMTIEGEEYMVYTITFTAEEINAWMAKFPPEALVMQGIDAWTTTCVAGTSSTVFAKTVFVGYIPE